MRAWIGLALLATVSALAHGPANAADAAKGEALARRWCAACHLVAADQDRVPTVAPPFATIAKKPGFGLDQLIKSTQPPHPQLPGRTLSAEQAADVAAYFATLAK